MAASLGFWRKAAAASRALQMVEEDKPSGCDGFTGTGDGDKPLTDERQRRTRRECCVSPCGENGSRGAAAAQLIYGDGLGDPALGKVSRETAGTQNSADGERRQRGGWRKWLLQDSNHLVSL
jgi:hypothetical protein